jgi:drug/metabolite transporter (DMT)-like permease
VLFLLALRTKSTVKTDFKTFGQIVFISLMGSCITPLLLFISYNYIPSGTSTVIHFIYPAVVVIGEFLFLKSNLKRGHIISVILSLAGISLFYSPADGINLEGSLCALASGFTYAMYVVALSAFKSKKMPVFILSFYVAAVCSVSMLCVCLFTKQLSLPTSLTGWLLLILFAFALNIGAVVLFQKGTFLAGGSRAAILSTFEPITSIFAGIVIFHESVSVFTVAGSILVIAASILIVLSDMHKSK